MMGWRMRYGIPRHWWMGWDGMGGDTNAGYDMKDAGYPGIFFFFTLTFIFYLWLGFANGIQLSST